jgi:hypothetical protein
MGRFTITVIVARVSIHWPQKHSSSLLEFYCMIRVKNERWLCSWHNLQHPSDLPPNQLGDLALAFGVGVDEVGLVDFLIAADAFEEEG